MSDFENQQPAPPEPPAQPAQSIPTAPSYDQGAPQPQYQPAPDQQAQAVAAYQQPVVNPAQPIMPTQATAPPEPKGFSGMFQDPATLAATGLLFAVLFAVVAGLINVLDGTTALDAQAR